MLAITLIDITYTVSYLINLRIYICDVINYDDWLYCVGGLPTDQEK